MKLTTEERRMLKTLLEQDDDDCWIYGALSGGSDDAFTNKEAQAAHRRVQRFEGRITGMIRRAIKTGVMKWK